MGWPRDTESFPEPTWWNGDQPFDTPANDDGPEYEEPELTDEEYERAAEDQQRKRDAGEGFDE